MNGKYLDIVDEDRRGKRVLLAMSGGVDSAVSAVKLTEAGYTVIGLTMKNYCYGDAEVPDRSCCSIEAIDDARGSCERAGIRHMVVSTEEIFGREVYDDFLNEYREGRTPNPCVRCNSIVRFSTLLDYADQMDADYVATGHYARVFKNDDNNRLYLARPRYLPKDQSYFLSGLKHEDLGRVIFPLGEHEKKEVRDSARAAGLDVADKPESQEVCFMPDGTLREFLDGKVDMLPGNIETVGGEVVGRHEGLASYTVGQRRGVGVAVGKPIYVVKIDRERNALVVGDDENLHEEKLTCRLNWIDHDHVASKPELMAQIRSRSSAEPITNIDVDGKFAHVTFLGAQRAIAPGQTIAFYDGDAVVGSGVIDNSGPQ